MKFDYDASKPFWLNHAKAIIQINDLDPIYEAAFKSRAILGDAKMRRFLVATSLFYHIGLASKIADESREETFWDCVRRHYYHTPRGTERRYFRGDQGLKCLDYLEQHFSGPSAFVDAMYRPNYHDMIKAFQPVPAFGEYFTWKWLDFFDRILGMPVDSEGCFMYVPKEPIKGAKAVAKQLGMQWGDSKKDDLPMLSAIMTHMIKELQAEGVMAPPNRGRLVGIQEVETALCMHIHYLNGSDYVGKDLLDKHDALSQYRGMAITLKNNLPPVVPRDFFTPPESVLIEVGMKRPKTTAELENFWA